MAKYNLPLNEVVLDFGDRLKSVSRGYASFDYHLTDYKRSRPGEDVDPGSTTSRSTRCPCWSIGRQRRAARPRDGREAQRINPAAHVPGFRSRPRSAARSSPARNQLRAFRKDVTAKCYGGDISRKRKLLDKQKEGKKKMRQYGKVDIPQEAFIAALKVDV